MPINPVGGGAGPNLNVSMGGVGKTTSNLSFAEKMQQGAANGAAMLTNGLSTALQFLPGGAVTSAAVSSAGSGMVSSLAANPGYGAFGGSAGEVGQVGGFGSGVGGGIGGFGGGMGGFGGGMGGIGGLGGNLSAISAGSNPISNIIGGGSATNPGDTSSMNQMMEIQYQMEQENEQFTMESNIMKTKHDMCSSIIQNIH